MKAITMDKFGGSEVLHVTEVATPEPAQNEVRIKIAYAAVNPVDWKIREGYLEGMFPHHFPLIPGWDAVGVVEKTGSGVSRFKVGDKVYAYARKPEVQWGTYAEYMTLDESAVAEIPRSLSLEEAGTVPLVGLTAWQALHKFGGIRKGQTVLIHGGAGGVGSFAIQFAKALGARVIATASLANHEYLRSLGADETVDYWTGKFPTEVDFVLDTIGGETLSKSYALLKRGGALVSITDTPDENQARERGIQVAFHFVEPSAEGLKQIAALFDEGKIRVPSYEVFRLEDARAAHEKSATGRVRGKILLKV